MSDAHWSARPISFPKAEIRDAFRWPKSVGVDIARALLSQPDILFLDEPTTGLDIQTRKSIWDLLYQLQREEGMTVVLTTHYLDEADEADQIYIVDHGKVIAQGSALDIKSQYAKTS